MNLFRINKRAQFTRLEEHKNTEEFVKTFNTEELFEKRMRKKMQQFAYCLIWKNGTKSGGRSLRKKNCSREAWNFEIKGNCYFADVFYTPTGSAGSISHEHYQISLINIRIWNTAECLYTRTFPRTKYWNSPHYSPPPFPSPHRLSFRFQYFTRKRESVEFTDFHSRHEVRRPPFS